MRHLINAYEGHKDSSRERWEQARLIAWYSAFDRKPLKLADIQIPFNDTQQKKADPTLQKNKADRYKILEKWNE